MERNEKAKFHYDLINLLTEGDSDEKFYERMIYALQIISTELGYFNEKIEEE